jgi:hypothetical protein
MSPRVVCDPAHAPVLDAEAGNLAILDDVDATCVRRAGVAPGDRVMACGAAARLEQAAEDRIARIVGAIEQRHPSCEFGAIEPHRVDAVELHGVAAPAVLIALGVGMGEVDDAALGEHDVEIEFLREPFPQLERPLVEVRVGLEQIIRTHDRGVAAGVAQAERAPLQHGYVGDAMFLGEVVGGREPVPAAADDHDVVARLGIGRAPRRLPAAVAAERFKHEAREGVHRNEGSPHNVRRHPEERAAGARLEGWKHTELVAILRDGRYAASSG